MACAMASSTSWSRKGLVKNSTAPGFHGLYRHWDVAMAGDEDNRIRDLCRSQLAHAGRARSNPGNRTSSTRQPGASGV